ncbi:unnamed protein product [Lactuca saligna]|uniref:Uncharacterized protein n=1 Tax=Lactuca saligna TaxID=75948 RepID=A0AA36E677_LACSI|nr:unnamed protein product [Lactuca saligna]
MGREREIQKLSRIMNVLGIINEFDDEPASSDASENASSLSMDKIIIIANQLPLKSKRRPDNRIWSFTWDNDSLLLRLEDGFPDDMEVLYVGSLNVDVDGIEQDDVAQLLYKDSFVSQLFFLLASLTCSILGFARNSCGLYFTTCY